MHKLIIVGSGPAGLTAAIYAGRANLSPIVIAGYKWGGQLMDTTVIENFPGFPEGIEGTELMSRMMKQAERWGAEIIMEDAVSVDLKGKIKVVNTYDKKFKSEAVIIASGSTPRRLQIPGEDEFYGRGVSTCATCDGALYRDKIVAVVGGGDSAMEETNFLTSHAQKVYLIHRKDSFRASPVMAERVVNNPKVEVVWDTEITEVIGENGLLSKLKLHNVKSNENSELEVAGLFLAIGHIPTTGIIKGQLPQDEHGFVLPVSFGSPKTNIPGVFVAGEVQDAMYKQAITTAADGCKAALEAQKYLSSLSEK